MDGKGDDALLKTSRVTEWTWNNGGYVSLLFGGFLLAGCLIAYIIAVARGNVDAFLPLISDAAGSPPQNGIFGTLICLGGMTGVVFMFLRYMIVLEKNQEKSKVVTGLNKLSLVVGLVSMCGITLVTGYPLNFYRNRDVWLSDVGIPHMIGGVTFFAFGLIYIALQCILTLFLKTKKRTTLLTRVAICFICTACFVYHLVTVPDNFGGISKSYYLNNTENDLNDTSLIPYPATMGSSLKLPIDTSGSYVYSAITEWILVLLFCCFFFTFYGEAQQYSLLIVIETHSPEPEHLNEIGSEQNGVKKPAINDSMVPEKTGFNPERRPSDVRTFLRRDSTCQTLSDDDFTAKKPTFTTFDNGKAKKRLSQSMDMFAGDKLEKLIESKFKKSNIESDNNISVGEVVKLTNGGKRMVTTSTETSVNGSVQTEDDIKPEIEREINGIIEESEINNDIKKPTIEIVVKLNDAVVEVDKSTDTADIKVT